MSEPPDSGDIGNSTNGPEPVPSKKTQGNRRNSRMSTGPKTPAGKARSARNARKHGLCGVGPITVGDGIEDVEAFAAMRRGLYAYWQPCGWQEQKLVESIAEDYLRLDRADRYENGIIRLNADHSIQRHALKRQSEFWSQLMAAVKTGGTATPRVELRTTSFGIDELLHELEVLKEELQSGADLGKYDANNLGNLFWRPQGEKDFSRLFLYARDELRRCHNERKGDEEKEWRNECIRLVDREAEVLREERKTVAAGELLQADLPRLISSLPEWRAYDLLDRYHTTIGRRIDRTMGTLEHLQSVRRRREARPVGSSAGEA